MFTTNAKRYPLLCLLLAATLTLLCACAQAPVASGVTLTDMLGREVTVPASPQKIVSLTPTNTEIVCALGFGDKLVAVDDYSNYPASVTDLPKVGGYDASGVEAIAALQPDLILTGDKLQQDAISALEKLGLTVIATEVTKLDQVDESIAFVAQALGAKDAGDKVVKAMTDRMDAVSAKTADLPDEQKPSVYWAVSFGEYGDFTVGKDAFPTDLLALAGGKSVSAASEYAWTMYTPEQIVADDPDVIIVSGDQSTLESFCASPIYGELRAVKEGHTYAIDPDMSSRPGPRMADALEAVYSILHP